MPPSVCTQSFAFSNAASSASDAAPAIASGPPLSALVVDGARRVPHRGAGELGAGQHVGTAVLHGLELADRTAELHPLLRVLARGVDTPLRDPDRLGREQHRGEIVHALGGDGRERVVERDDRTVDVDPRRRAG